MAHYAVINEDNIVVQVFVGKDEGQGTDWEVEYGKFYPGHIVRRTSYNTRGGKYLNADGTEHEDQSKAFRKNYAGKGCIWDEARDAFYHPSNYPSWTFNETTCMWQAPHDPVPSDHPTGEEFDQGWRVVWDEDAYQADNTTGWKKEKLF